MWEWYLESFIDDCMCNEIINAADNVYTNVTSTVWRYVYNKKVRYKMEKTYCWFSLCKTQVKIKKCIAVLTM